MGHRNQGLVLLERFVEGDFDLFMRAGLEVLRGTDDALEDVSHEEAAIVDRHETGARDRDVLDDDRLAIGRLIFERHVRGLGVVVRVRGFVVGVTVVGDRLVSVDPRVCLVLFVAYRFVRRLVR